MVKVKHLRKIKKSTNNNTHNLFLNDSKIRNYKRIKNQIRRNNPSFNKYKIDSHFVYESKLYQLYTKNYKNLNKIKPKNIEISVLKEAIKDIATKESNLDIHTYIEVHPVFKEIFDKMEKITPILNETDQTVQLVLNELSEEVEISIKKIKQMMSAKYNINISCTKIHNILKNKLNFSYLKTAIKNKDLTTKNYIAMSFFFLKIILRGIKLGITFIFIDESGFCTNAPNFRTWRSKNSDFYYNIKNQGKTNLIMGVDMDEIIHYEIIDQNIDSITFLNFMKTLVSKLDEERLKNTIIIMDNFSSHLTKDLFEFYNEKKLKILFNTPYLSKFNMIELCFRELKNKIYKRLYKNIKEIKDTLKDLIEGDYLKGILYKLYKETLIKYLDYINNNITINLN